MSLVRIELLAGFSARLRDGRRCLLPTRKTEALLAYLALPPGRFHTRDKLTGLLWGDTAEVQARQSFRQTLARLRRALGEGVLLARGDAVALDPDAATVDVSDLEAALAENTVDSLRQVNALYKGDLLDGFSVDESPFEEWRTVERERIHERVLEGLARLLREHVRAEQIEPAIQAAQKILALDPLQESAHQALMRLLWRAGRRAAALQQYQACVGALQRELGTEPDEDTRALYRELLQAAHPARDARQAAGGIIATPSDRSGHRPADHPMVGRAAEMEALAQTLDRALDIGGRVAVISGEAGIGKSRLIQELGARASTRGMRILGAWCHETEQPLPFRPWIDALRGSPGIEAVLREGISAPARGSLVRVFPELGRPDERPAATEEEHAVLFEALGEVVQCLSQEAPLLIVLEDMHWADDMSVRLLAFLGRRLGARPVLIAGSMRCEDVLEAPALEPALAELRKNGNLDEMLLGALSRDETLALARILRPAGKRGTAVDAIADDLWKLSEGNPFVIVETMQALDPDGGGSDGRPCIARTVRQSVSARLGRLSEPARLAVATAAVIGHACSFKLLAQSTGLGEMDAATAVEELVRRRVLEAIGDRLVVRHDRIRQIAYDDLLPARRIAVHGTVARALERLHAGELDEVADELGHHFLRAGEPEQALRHLERFAEIATRRYAIDAALASLHQATEAVEQLPKGRRARHHLDLALRRASVLTAGGRHHASLDVLRACASRQQSVPDSLLASEYHYRLAITTFYLGRYADARPAGAAALQHSEATGDPERIGRALYALALINTAAGQVDEVAANCARAIAHLHTPSTRRRLAAVHWIRAVNRIYTGQFHGAMEDIEQCAGLADAVGDTKLWSMAIGLESWVHTARGDGGVALECAQRALDAAQGTIPTSLALRWVGYAHLHRGEARPAIDILEQACKGMKHFPVRHTYVESLAFLAEAYVLGHDAEKAGQAARRAIELARSEGSPFNLGLAERAAAHAARAIGDEAAAETHLGRAIEAFLSNGAAFEAGITRLDLARAIAAGGALDDARKHLVEAAEAFNTAGTPSRLAQVRELAESLGIDL